MFKEYRNIIFVSLISLPSVVIGLSSLIKSNILVGQNIKVVVFYLAALLISGYILREFENLIFISLISFSTITIIFPSIIMSIEPNRQQINISILFLVSLLLYGLYCGYNKTKSFLRFSAIYWGTGYFLLNLAHHSGAISLVPIIILFMGPTYGLTYFIQTPNAIKLIIINIALIYGISILAYYIGWISLQKRMMNLNKEEFNE